MNELIKKLITIQKELKAPKSNYNSFGKYNYRSAEDILEAVKPLNAEQGLLLTLTDEPILIGDWHYIKAKATLTDGENELTVTAYARESENKKGMDHSQITGTASSYARKYALNGLYLIDDTKDADTDEYRNQNNNQSNTQQDNSITREQVGILKTKVLEFGKLRNVTDKEVYKALRISDVTKLSKEQAIQHIKQLDIWIKGAKDEAKSSTKAQTS